MGTRTRIALIVVVAAAAAYPLAAWLIGIGVESQLRRAEQQALGTSPYLVLVQRDYHRGIYRASEDLTLRFGGPLARVLRNVPGGAALLAARLTVHSTIYHGPLPRLHAVALATIDSELQLPPAWRRQLEPVLAGHPPLQLSTTMGFDGGGRVEVRSAAFHYQAADGSAFNTPGWAATLTGGRGLNDWTIDLLLPALTLRSAGASVAIEGMALSESKHRVFDTLYVGTSRLRLSRLAVQTGAVPLTLRGLSMSTESSAAAQYLETNAELSADALQLAQFSATRLVYDQRFAHLYGPSLAALTQALRESQRAGGGGALAQGQILAALRQYGAEVALHAPVLTISQLTFAMPEGQLHLSGQLSVPGLTRAELQGAAALAALARHARLSLDLRVDSALANRLLGSSSQAQLFTSELDQFRRQGYLKSDGTVLTSHIEYLAGRLTINGQPYPPPAAGAP